VSSRVSLSLIAFDAGTQIRASINESVVAEYADRMTDGVEFPPIVLFHDGNQHYLADGFHRFMAARRNEFRDIEADVRAGTKQDALWFALGANKHGLQLTSVDKKHAVLLAINSFPDRSQNQIAAQVGCSQRYVSTLKEQVRTTSNLPQTVIGKDNKPYPATKGEHPKLAEIESRLKAGETVHGIAGALSVGTHTVGAVKRGLGIGPDKTKAGVAQRRKDIADMAGRGFTTRQIASSLGVVEAAVTKIAKEADVIIHADRVVGKTRRHDSMRIVETMVMDAENLTADVNLIEFADLPKEAIARWVDSLQASHRSLAAFIKRLKKEQSSVEAVA
jgi:hypothetical protein